MLERRSDSDAYWPTAVLACLKSWNARVIMHHGRKKERWNVVVNLLNNRHIQHEFFGRIKLLRRDGFWLKEVRGEKQLQHIHRNQSIPSCWCPLSDYRRRRSYCCHVLLVQWILGLGRGELRLPNDHHRAKLSIFCLNRISKNGCCVANNWFERIVSACVIAARKITCTTTRAPAPSARKILASQGRPCCSPAPAPAPAENRLCTLSFQRPGSNPVRLKKIYLERRTVCVFVIASNISLIF